MKKVLFILLIVMLGYPANLMAGLQEEKLVGNVLLRFQGIIAEKGGDPDSVTRESIVLERSIPFEVNVSGHSLTMYAVRMMVMSGPEKGQNQPVTLIVDETGTIQLDGVFADLSTGRSIHQQVMDELARLEENPPVGDLLLKGPGQADVLFLSDPFCPYCRHAYDFLLDQQNRISELKIAHFPLNPDSGAVALTFLMMEHKGKDSFRDVVDFAYTIDRALLTDNADLSVIRIYNEEFEAYTRTPEEMFDYLQEKHQGNLLVQMEQMRGIGLSGTPLIFVDGIRVEGFNRDRVENLLDKAN